MCENQGDVHHHGLNYDLAIFLDLIITGTIEAVTLFTIALIMSSSASCHPQLQLHPRHHQHHRSKAFGWVPLAHFIAPYPRFRV